MYFSYISDRSYSNNYNKMAQKINSSITKNTSNFKYDLVSMTEKLNVNIDKQNIEKYQIINFLDFGKLPINVNFLKKEIPFTNIVNFSNFSEIMNIDSSRAIYEFLKNPYMHAANVNEICFYRDINNNFCNNVFLNSPNVADPIVFGEERFYSVARYNTYLTRNICINIFAQDLLSKFVKHIMQKPSDRIDLGLKTIYAGLLENENIEDEEIL